MKSGVKILAKALTGGLLWQITEICMKLSTRALTSFQLYTHWRKTGERSIVAHFVLLVERPVSVSMHLRAVFVSLSKPTEIEFIIQTPRTSFVFRFDGKGIGFRKQLLCFSTQEPDILIIVALTVVYKARKVWWLNANPKLTVCRTSRMKNGKS